MQKRVLYRLRLGRFLAVFLLSALLFAGCSQPAGSGGGGYTPPAPAPVDPAAPAAPSLIRRNGEILVGWAAETKASYEVWYGTTNNNGSAAKWNGTISRPAATVAATTITGLSNGTVYYVWIKTTGGTVNGFGAGKSETPEAPKTPPDGFVYVPGGTVTGSGSYQMTVTVPNDPAYDFPGQTSTHKGVFVAGRTLTVASFFMAKYETTRQLWYEVQSWATANGYTFQNPMSSAGSSPNMPVTGISWRDAVAWCNAYSEKAGLQAVYRYGGNVIKDSTNANAASCDGAVMDKTKSGYRLPTEAEREYAARGGDPGKADWMYLYAGSNDPDAVAWHYGNSANQLRDVGGKSSPNRLGIYDLSGNAQEWGWDWMHYARDVTAATPLDGAAYSAQFNQKPMAGGSVGANVTYSCVAYRWGFTPDNLLGYVGFRVVRKAE